MAKTLRLAILGSTAAAVALMTAAPASAAVLIGISVNGAGPVTVASGASTASYNNTVDGVEYDVFANGMVLSAQSPDLFTQTFDVRNLGSTVDTLSIYVTETGLTDFDGVLLSSFTSNFTMGLEDSPAITSYYSASNAQYGGTVLQSFSSFPGANVPLVGFVPGIGTFAGANALDVEGPFSVTVRYDLDFADGAPGSFNGTAQLVGAPVPEPATWAMMLVGFGAIGFGMRRRKAVSAQPRMRVQYA